MTHGILSLIFHRPEVERQSIQRPHYPSGSGCEAFRDAAQRARCERLQRSPSSAGDDAGRDEPSPGRGSSVKLVPLLGPTSGLALVARF